MIYEDDIETLIIHGFGVEGEAALSYWHARINARIIIIDRPVALTRVALTDVPPERLLLTSEEDFLASPMPDADTSLYLRSPGIPPTNPVFEKIQDTDIFHTTPTGYWLALNTPKNLVTITGTKGKSTTTDLTAQLLQWAGRDAIALGNIGVPPFAAEISPDTICIVELSSYMMHDLPQIDCFHCVTSLYREHLDWHGTFEAYAGAKLCPYSWSPAVDGLMSESLCTHLPGAATPPQLFEHAVPIEDAHLVLDEQTEVHPAALNDAFQAPSLLLALRAAVAICLTRQYLTATELKTVLEQRLPDWPGLPSRQEILPTNDGRLWVNDALATVPEATLSALERFRQRTIHLLLGGQDRGQDFDTLLTYCRDQKIHVYAFGEVAEKIAASANTVRHSARRFDTLEEMITAAADSNDENAAIIFSPAAPSGPPHASFRERARIFADQAAQYHAAHKG